MDTSLVLAKGKPSGKFFGAALKTASKSALVRHDGCIATAKLHEIFCLFEVNVGLHITTIYGIIA